MRGTRVRGPLRRYRRARKGAAGERAKTATLAAENGQMQLPRSALADDRFARPDVAELTIELATIERGVGLVGTDGPCDLFAGDRTTPGSGLGSTLPLDYDQRNSFARHLDCLCVPELMGRTPSPHPGCASGTAELRADSSRRAWSPTCRAAQNA